jgi:HEAT repeat protein
MLSLRYGVFLAVVASAMMLAHLRALEVAPRVFVMQSDAARLVEQMRGISMQRRPIARSDGRIDPLEQRRGEITDSLRGLGDEAIGALARALGDVDVQMRRNAALVLIDLGGGYSATAQTKVNTLTALSALIQATRDSDRDVRGWAAHAIAEMGPRAQPAVSALVTLLRDTEEGPRNTACIALGNIGPGAAEALPALQLALNDPRPNVRGFAQRAIDRIQGKAPSPGAAGR